MKIDQSVIDELKKLMEVSCRFGLWSPRIEEIHKMFVKEGSVLDQSVIGG